MPRWKYPSWWGCEFKYNIKWININRMLMGHDSAVSDSSRKLFFGIARRPHQPNLIPFEAIDARCSIKRPLVMCANIWSVFWKFIFGEWSELSIILSIIFKFIFHEAKWFERANHGIVCRDMQYGWKYCMRMSRIFT